MNLKSFRFYDRMLPAQDSVGDGELGYLIALPLQGQALKKDNNAFVDKDWNAYPDQWETLFAVKKLSAQTMESCIKRWNVPETDRGSFLPEDTKPWERKTSFHTEDVDGQLCMTLANRIYIETGNLKPRLQNQIRRMAAIQNPMFYRNQAMGLSNYANSRFIYLGEDDSGFLCIPRGLLDALLDRCGDAEIPVKLTDERAKGRTLTAKFTGQLRENRRKP